jgi:hypothetical protein
MGQLELIPPSRRLPTLLVASHRLHRFLQRCCTKERENGTDRMGNVPTYNIVYCALTTNLSCQSSLHELIYFPRIVVDARAMYLRFQCLPVYHGSVVACRFSPKGADWFFSFEPEPTSSKCLNLVLASSDVAASSYRGILLTS